MSKMLHGKHSTLCCRHRSFALSKFYHAAQWRFKIKSKVKHCSLIMQRDANRLTSLRMHRRFIPTDLLKHARSGNSTAANDNGHGDHKPVNLNFTQSLSFDYLFCARQWSRNALDACNLKPVTLDCAIELANLIDCRMRSFVHRWWARIFFCVNGAARISLADFFLRLVSGFWLKFRAPKWMTLSKGFFRVCLGVNDANLHFKLFWHPVARPKSAAVDSR